MPAMRTRRERAGLAGSLPGEPAGLRDSDTASARDNRALALPLCVVPVPCQRRQGVMHSVPFRSLELSDLSATSLQFSAFW